MAAVGALGHEAGHLACAYVLGYSARRLRLDVKYADWGFVGAIDNMVRTTGDPAREPFDRARIAAMGPLKGGGVELTHPTAAADLRNIDAWRVDGWPVEAWRMNATEQARRLARTEAVSSAWRGFVVALGDLGDEFVELEGDDLAAFVDRAVTLVGVRS